MRINMHMKPTTLQPIDSNLTAHITLLGSAFAKDFKQQDGTRLLGRKVRSAYDLAVLAQVGQLLKQPDEFFALIGVNTKGFVQSISEIPLSVLQQKDHVLHARLRRFARHSGIDSVFAVTDPDNLKHPQFIKAIESGVLRDVVAISGDSEGQTLQEMGIFSNVLDSAENGLFRKNRTTIIDNGLKVKRGGRSC